MEYWIFKSLHIELFLKDEVYKRFKDLIPSYSYFLCNEGLRECKDIWVFLEFGIVSQSHIVADQGL